MRWVICCSWDRYYQSTHSHLDNGLAQPLDTQLTHSLDNGLTQPLDITCLHRFFTNLSPSFHPLPQCYFVTHVVLLFADYGQVSELHKFVSYISLVVSPFLILLLHSSLHTTSFQLHSVLPYGVCSSPNGISLSSICHL